MENRPLEQENSIESIHNASHGEGTESPSQGDSQNTSSSHDRPTSSDTSDVPLDVSRKSSENSGKSKSKKASKSSVAPTASVPVRHWFVTLMCMNIPIIGWIYLIILACSRSKGPRRDFAKAYLLYKLVFLLLSLAILAVALHYGLELLAQILAYMEML